MPLPSVVMHVVAPDQEASLGDVMIVSRRLIRRGVEVLVAGALSRPTQERLSEAKCRWVNLPMPTAADPAPWLQVARQLRRLVQSLAPDVLHCHGLLVGTAAAVALRGLRLPPRLIVSLPDLGSRRLSPVMGFVARWALSRAQLLTVSTAADMAQLQRTYRGAAARARIIHHAVEIRPTRGDFDVGMKRRALGVSPHTAVVGVISPALADTGLTTFLEAAAAVTHQFPNVEFLVVGDGPDQEALQIGAHDLGIGGAVIFRGSRTDIPEIIGSLNVLVIPGEVPGAVRNALQAVVQEIPVIAVRTGALGEVLDDIYPDGLVPAGDAGALAAAISHNLELLPPPEAEAGVFVDSGITLSYSDLLVAREAYDLDTAGLEAEGQDESPVRGAALRAQRRFSSEALVHATEELYAEAQMSMNRRTGQQVAPR